MIDRPAFWLALSFVLLHEMDAVRCREWRIFPGLSLLDDKRGFQVFMACHTPLFYFLLQGLSAPDPSGLVTALDYFFIIHLGLHLLYLWHPKNEFKDGWSWLFIGGTAISGAFDLWV